VQFSILKKVNIPEQEENLIAKPGRVLLTAGKKTDKQFFYDQPGMGNSVGIFSRSGSSVSYGYRNADNNKSL